MPPQRDELARALGEREHDADAAHPLPHHAAKKERGDVGDDVRIAGDRGDEAARVVRLAIRLVLA